MNRPQEAKEEQEHDFTPWIWTSNPPSPFSRSADDGDGDNDNSESTSPRYEPNIHHASTPPLPHHEDMESSRKNTDGSNADEPGDDDFLSRRRKLSDALVDSTTLSNHNAQSPYPLSIVLEDLEEGEADESATISVKDNLASTARTTPEMFASDTLKKTKPNCLQT